LCLQVGATATTTHTHPTHQHTHRSLGFRVGEESRNEKLNKNSKGVAHCLALHAPHAVLRTGTNHPPSYSRRNLEAQWHSLSTVRSQTVLLTSQSHSVRPNQVRLTHVPISQCRAYSHRNLTVSALIKYVLLTSQSHSVRSNQVRLTHVAISQCPL
jgi:hypothetical protein